MFWSILLIAEADSSTAAFQSDRIKRHVLTCDVYTIEQAAKKMEDEGFDTIFVEINDSAANGVERLQNVVQLAPDQPIVILTNTRDQETLASFLRYGAQDIIHTDDIDEKVIPRVIRYAIDRKSTSNQLAVLERQDTLTGLVNRKVFMDRLERSLSETRSDAEMLAVLLLDLNKFKSINDTLGHTTGDEVIKAVAERICNCLYPVDTVARLAGDEFAILLENVSGPEAIQVICKKILTEFEDPIFINGNEIYTSASIGIATTTRRGKVAPSPGNVIKHADIAMYRAKHEGGNRFVFFTRELQVAASIRSTLETALRRAVERQEFSIVYQPQIDTNNHALYGAETLLRWNHPSYGDLSPTTFVPALEASGLITPVTEWVIRRTLADWANMIKQNYISAGTSISINLSPKLLSQKNFAQTAADIADSCGINRHSVFFEITENLFVDSSQQTLSALHQIKSEGFKLSMDDFGTGYSSLSYLKHFPLDCIKLDRAFIKDILHSKIDAAIAEAAVNLARKINIGIIAEGVDEERKLAMVRQYGCNIIQGMLFSGPLTVEEFTEYCQNDTTVLA